jgi:hypothetical protein
VLLLARIFQDVERWDLTRGDLVNVIDSVFVLCV